MLKKIQLIKNSTWIIYIALTSILFVGCVWFHYSYTQSILISSLWKNPLSFWGFYLPKLFISMLFASTVFFMKQKWSVLLYTCILFLWFYANTIYIRSYGAPLDAFAMTMAGNMNGFWDAVAIYLEWKDLVYVLLLTMVVTTVWIMPTIKKRQWKTGLISMAICYILCGLIVFLPNYIYASTCGVDNENYKHEFPSLKVVALPFSKYARSVGMGTSLEYDFSILHFIGFDVVDYVSILQDKQHAYVLTDQDICDLQPCIGNDTCIWNGGKQIIILVESLEAWAVRPEVMPNVCNLLNQPSFFATRVKNQARAGGSADGQMIVNTGLLPIKEDAVCFRFPLNTFPTYPKGKSATLIPHPIEVWNQMYMSPAYGYDTTVICSAEDSLLFAKAVELLDEGYDMMQIVTITSHAPFSAGKSVDISVPEAMPTMMHDYLGCLKLTDEGIGVLLNKLQQDSRLNNTTIVITGDHTVFPIDKRKQYATICANNKIDYAVEEAFVPLIISSPLIDENIEYTDTCYQMDIFPTVMSSMGYDDNYWKGLGVSLLHTHEERVMDETEAFNMSDKLIRANYFNK